MFCNLNHSHLAAYAAVIGLAALPPQPPSPTTSWGKTVHGLRAGIRMERDADTVKIGERFKAKLVIKNVSGHEIDLAFANGQRHYGWRVKEQGGRSVIAPRWRYSADEKIEKEVMGAVSFHIGAGVEVEVPMDSPDLLVTSPRPANHLDAMAGAKGTQLTVTGRLGQSIQIMALPLTAIARGEEWVDKLETGVLKVRVAAAAPR